MASLNHQFNIILQEAFAPGASKRSYREQRGDVKLDKIFSFSTYTSMKSTAIELAKYLSAYGIKRLDEIRPEHIKEYLAYKADGCNRQTMIKLASHIESLGLFAHEKFKSVNPEYFKSDISMLITVKEENVKYKRPMQQDDYEKIMDYLSRTDANKTECHLRKALLLERYTGLRCDEAANQKVRDFHLDERGKYGFGYITVTNPKHGRVRIVHLMSNEARGELRKMQQDCKGEFIIPVKAKTLQNQLGIVKRLIDINAPYQGAHSVRKRYAQDFYDFSRKKHTKREAIRATNEQLGHSASRNVAELRTYVENLY